MNIINWISIGLWCIYFVLFVYKVISTNKVKNKINILFLILFIIYSLFIREEILTVLYLILIITNLVYLLTHYFHSFQYITISKATIKYFFISLVIISFIFFYLLFTNTFHYIYFITLLINVLFIPLYKLFSIFNSY